MLDPVPRRTAPLRSVDVAGYAAFDGALGDVGASRDGPAMQYWLSAPYLANLMDDYKMKRRLREATASPAQRTALARRWRTGRGLLPFDDVREYRSIDPATQSCGPFKTRPSSAGCGACSGFLRHFRTTKGELTSSGRQG